MKKRIFSIVLALVFACMPLTGVYAAPQTVEVETTEEADVQSENAQDEATLSALPKLPTPTDLRWNEDWREFRYEMGEKYNGFISWNAVANAEGSYKIYVYCNGQQVYETSWSGKYDMNGDGRVGIEIVAKDIFDKSGTYTFKIIARGDKQNYTDSDPAESKGYSYTLPAAKLATPQNIRLDNNGIVYFTPVENACGYMITLYDQNMEAIGWTNSYGNKPLENQPDIVEDDNADYIADIISWNDWVTSVYATVKAISYDIEKYQNGDESGFSNAYQIGEINEEISGELNEDTMDMIESGELPADEALDNFLGYLDNNDLTNTDLAVSMLRDETLANNIDTLEEKFIEQTGIEAKPQNTASDPNYLADRGIDVNDITIKGAALNSKDGQDVNINFSEADPSHSADPKFYKNSVAVNIGATGVENSQKLDIPVIIEMPIPTGVVAHRLFILHYHADGSVEQIHPAIIEKGGKNYARFILTSFSTFIFCNAQEDVMMGNVYAEDESDTVPAEVSIKDIIALRQYLAGERILTPEQLMVANICTEDDIEGATVDVNINEKDVEALAQMLV